MQLKPADPDGGRFNPKIKINVYLKLIQEYAQDCSNSNKSTGWQNGL